jgi:ABC-type iron transport system FetAB ATPase subunit
VARLEIHGLRCIGRGPFDLGVEAGECVALSGPSGAGKTLLLRAVADLDPHEGHVTLDGAGCGSMPAPAWRRRVGLLPSESQWWRATVGEHFDGVEDSALESLGFGREALDWPIVRLSSGERQRLAVLRILAHEPRVLLLDEPTANLDAESTERVEDLIASYRKRTDAAVLWVTHGAEQARRVARRAFRVTAGGLLPEPGA